MARRTATDLVIVSALALIGLVVILARVDLPLLRALLAGPLVLVLPGYALTVALSLDSSRGSAEVAAMSLGLSLAIAALGGLVLELLPGGIRAQSWTLLLCAVTLACSAAGWWRRQHAPPESFTFGQQQQLITLKHGMMFAASIVLVGGAIWVARTPAVEQPNQAYSVLWAVPVSDDPNLVRLGVSSAEPENESFVVRVVTGDQVLQEFPIQLAPAGTWESEIALSGPTTHSLEVQLSKAASPDTVYRHVDLRTGG